jgi:hypothetical protein
LQGTTLTERKALILCTGGTLAVLDSTSGCAALVKKVAPDVVITLRFLHWKALVSDTLRKILDKVLSTPVRVLNCIKASTWRQHSFPRYFVMKWE